MHLCTCLNEEGGDGESTDSETLSLMSYTLRYVSLPDLDRLCVFRTVVIRYTQKGGGRSHNSVLWSPSKTFSDD